MLMCSETVTLVHRAEQGDADTYVCTVVEGASWFAKTSIAVSKSGAKPVNTLQARIPAGRLPGEITPQAGDYLVRGRLMAFAQPAELAGLTYFQITAVGDNRRGRNPHWRLSGA